MTLKGRFTERRCGVKPLVGGLAENLLKEQSSGSESRERTLSPRGFEGE